MTLQQAKIFTLRVLHRPQKFSWHWADITHQPFTIGTLVNHKGRMYKVIAVHTKEQTFTAI